MNPPKCPRNDVINFLIAAFQTCSCTEASRCVPSDSAPIAHDSVKRLLERQPHHTEALYNEAKQMIQQNEGEMVIDDSTLDKLYSRQIELVTRHWRGKHHRVVQGINLVSTIWTDGTATIPVDYRIYNHEFDTYDHIPLVWVSAKIISNFSPEIRPILGDFIKRYGNLEAPNRC